ncbi:MAG: hypothetical protein EAY75_09195 [Bacteroidetes bacterium]|nr:MAG: hypothetical protein EAY75_09195 [Bacteroidota bacterium]
MTPQDYKTHRRLVPGFHYVTLPLILLGLIGSGVNLARAEASNHYSAALLMLVFLIAVLISWYVRSFALKAQDRAIRAEENFRHYVLTGKALPSTLRMGQIIALRFASDAEFPALSQRAANEQLKADDIKKAIVDWRGDHYRV